MQEREDRRYRIVRKNGAGEKRWCRRERIDGAREKGLTVQERKRIDRRES